MNQRGSSTLNYYLLQNVFGCLGSKTVFSMYSLCYVYHYEDGIFVVVISA